MFPERDWKSRVADNLERMGEGGSAKKLYGVGDKKRPPVEMTRAQMEAEGKRRMAMSRQRPKTLIGRLRAWLKI